MTCDDAFDRLTSPGSAVDPRLAKHLSRCARCRAMADTLAPAIRLFESTTSAGAPPASSTAVAIASSTAARLTQRSARSGPFARSGWMRRLGLASAGLAGLACCAWALQSGETRPETPTVASCPRRSPAATDWMSQNSFPVAAACVACHPPAGALAPVARPAVSTRGTL